jgi:rhamnulose-1-phosphate aldolase
MHDDAVKSAIAPVLDQVRDVAGWLWERGWAERNAGNVSIDVTEDLAGHAPGGATIEGPGLRRGPFACAVGQSEVAGRAFLVSGTGVRFRDLAREPRSGTMVVRVDGDAAGYDIEWDPSGGSLRPTSELISHLAVHARLRAVAAPRRVVLHTHPTHLVALNHTLAGAAEVTLNQVLWAMMPEVKVFVPEGVALAPYRTPGSAALAEATTARVAEHRVIVWDKHGCVATERDLVEAFDLLDTLDKAARLYLLCLAAGSVPRGLTADEVDDLGRLAADLGTDP